jgi:uridine kinase
MSFCTFEDIILRMEQVPSPALIAIDGLPCSGKSSLAARLESHFGIESIHLDSFLIPASGWTSREPDFPFPYMRYADFIGTVEALAAEGTVTYFPFDWDKEAIAETPRTVRLDRHVIVEGVSSLNPVLAPLYGLSVFVESDRNTAVEAAIRRDGGWWADEWRTLFLPSTDLYMRTDPKSRADLIFPGRDA